MAVVAVAKAMPTDSFAASRIWASFKTEAYQRQDNPFHTITRSPALNEYATTTAIGR